MPSKLAASLRAETQALHAQVEAGPFMAALLGGRLDKRQYCLLLRNLRPIYAALEAALSRHVGHAALAPFTAQPLFRTQAITDDLVALHGDAWSSELQVLPACVQYAAHLQSLAQQQPERLVAHAYVRYLGDLSGGQMLRTIVARSLQLPPAGSPDRFVGTAFYDFGSRDEAKRTAMAFRADLDAVPVEEPQAVIAEARAAFERHIELFAELSRACGLPQGAATALP